MASRRKLSYAEAQREGMPLLARLGTLREARAQARGATRLDLPAQEVVLDPDNPCGFRLHWEERLPIEDWNAHVSLLVGMGAAERMLEMKIGLLRVMDTPDPARLAAAQAAAARLHGVAALTALRHAMGRASYAFFDGAPPDPVAHYALAAPYAHVTAPMRRLCDRYVLELLADGPDETLRGDLARLPETMAKADARAGRLERELIDATEACTLVPRIGERFKAVVLASDERGVADPDRGPADHRPPRHAGRAGNAAVRTARHGGSGHAERSRSQQILKFPHDSTDSARASPPEPTRPPSLQFGSGVREAVHALPPSPPEAGESPPRPPASACPRVRR